MAWEHLGMRGEGTPPDCLDKYTGTLLIVGSGRCVWQDLDQFLGPGGEGQFLEKRLARWVDREGWNGHRGDIMAINDIGLFLNCKLKHWASKHPNHLVARHALRCQLRPAGEKALLHSHQPYDGIDHVWDLKVSGGLSGFFAMKVGVLLGYERIVMAGCPTDGSGRFWQPVEDKSGHGAQVLAKTWLEEMEKVPILKERCRSMSGNTKKWLGTPEWVGNITG